MLRTKRGWTQQQLADMAAIGRVHVSELENGRREAGPRVLDTLAASFNITASELLKDHRYDTSAMRWQAGLDCLWWQSWKQLRRAEHLMRGVAEQERVEG